jgi:hypothetical protein
MTRSSKPEEEFTMNGDKFEQDLKRQSMRPVPVEWRREILKIAGDASRCQAEARGIGGVWWREWLSFTRVAWSGVAVAWVAILTLNWAANRPGGPGSVEAVFSPTVVALALERSGRLRVRWSGAKDWSHDRLRRIGLGSARVQDFRTV